MMVYPPFIGCFDRGVMGGKARQAPRTSNVPHIIPGVQSSVQRAPSRNASIPRSFDLSHERWVNNPIPERLDERHVCLPERTPWLDVDGHLSSLVAAFAPIDPGQMHHGVHGSVRQFRGKFDIGAIEGHERRPAEIRIRRRVAQIVWQSIDQ
jgi:hypothetical protein